MPKRTLRADARTMPIASLTSDPVLLRAFAAGPDREPTFVEEWRNPPLLPSSDAVKAERELVAA
jgi:hypothetical protein